VAETAPRRTHTSDNRRGAEGRNPAPGTHVSTYTRRKHMGTGAVGRSVALVSTLRWDGSGNVFGILVFILTVADLTLPLTAARGSLPVERTLTGCVVGAAFYSVSLHEATRTPVKAYRIRFDKPVDVTPYEGKTISITGWLSPGDRFRLKDGAPPTVVRDTCNEEYRKVITTEFILGYVVEASKAARRNDFAEAFRLINKAIDLDRGRCGTYIERAYLSYARGDFASGAQDVQRVREGQCADPATLNFLTMKDIGKILVSHGKRPEALQVYRMALDSCQTDICRDSIQKDMGPKE
jgi:hypothetical protein